MDFLASLHVEDLPEQQTRMLHLLDAHPDFQLQLGFDACCACGKADPSLSCRNCQRVRYCSEECRQQDAAVPSYAGSRIVSTSVVVDPEQQEGGETAMGHTAILCSLLKLCNDDEAVEEGDAASLDSTRHEAATNRVRSEYESYPATLANVLLEGPCFQETLLRRQNELVVHVVGASSDAELSQGPTVASANGSFDDRGVCKDYAEALAELADRYSIHKIALVFVGPECPEQAWQETINMQNGDKSVGTLSITTVRGIYNSQTLSQISVGAVADVVVFFNPGFTVPDYEHWKETLQSIPAGTPFLSTTNTEMEGIADCQFLLDQDKIQSLPPGLADILGVYSTGDEEDDERCTSFFSVNPFCGSRVRQSVTMANDLYVKNRWMLGSIVGSFDPSSVKEESVAKKRKPTTVSTASDSNSKAGNPALI